MLSRRSWVLDRLRTRFFVKLSPNFSLVEFDEFLLDYTLGFLDRLIDDVAEKL